ncbi:MAG: hypothetical protein HY906_09770 [Deltaproteobacteria bacterium]|nr:hypothetical protein [Deltaproteobacteria bacterium]
MPDYARLREYVSHRVTFDYENGARIVGYVGQTRPPSGPVQTVMVSAALLYSPAGKLVGQRPELSLVPNLLVTAQKDSGRMVLEFDSGARIVGTPADDPLGASGFLTLRGAAIHDSNGRVIERHDELVVVPRTLLSCRVTEGPLGQ